MIDWCLQRAQRFWSSFRWWPEGDRIAWVLTALMLSGFGLQAITETLVHGRPAISLLIACFLARSATRHYLKARFLSQRLFEADMQTIKDTAESGEDAESVCADLAAIKHKIATGYYDA